MISQFIFFIKRHTQIKDFLKLIIAVSYFPIIVSTWLFAKLNSKIPSNIWLIGELGVDAKDNGYFFFKYLRNEHPEVNTYFYIDTKKEVSKKVARIGSIVEYGSFKHMIVFMKSKYIISTQDMYAIPWGRINWREFKLVYPWIAKNKRFVFLQHGVTKDDASKNANYKRTHFDYFITTAKREFEDISSDKYGYRNGQVIEPGFPRFDNLYNRRNDPLKRQILLMPTWRQYLADISKEDFMKSRYYLAFNELFNDDKLIMFLKEHNMQLLFFPPHREIQKFLYLFKTSNSKLIRFIDVDKESLTDLMLQSTLMITDYSSVAFDFAYLKKPLVYYQFDLDEYRLGHYKEGYFSYLDDGFGPIVKDKDELIKAIISISNNGFHMNKNYLDRTTDFFDLYDNHNSQRLFDVLK